MCPLHSLLPLLLPPLCSWGYPWRTPTPRPCCMQPQLWPLVGFAPSFSTTEQRNLHHWELAPGWEEGPGPALPSQHPSRADLKLLRARPCTQTLQGALALAAPCSPTQALGGFLASQGSGGAAAPSECGSCCSAGWLLGMDPLGDEDSGTGSVSCLLPRGLALCKS